MAIYGGGVLPTSINPYRPFNQTCHLNRSTLRVTLAGFTDIDDNECALLQTVCNQPVTVAVNVRREALCAGLRMGRALPSESPPLANAACLEGVKEWRGLPLSFSTLPLVGSLFPPHPSTPAHPPTHHPQALLSRTSPPAVCTTHPC